MSSFLSTVGSWRRNCWSMCRNFFRRRSSLCSSAAFWWGVDLLAYFLPLILLITFLSVSFVCSLACFSNTGTPQSPPLLGLFSPNTCSSRFSFTISQWSWMPAMYQALCLMLSRVISPQPCHVMVNIFLSQIWRLREESHFPKGTAQRLPGHASAVAPRLHLQLPSLQSSTSMTLWTFPFGLSIDAQTQYVKTQLSALTPKPLPHDISRSVRHPRSLSCLWPPPTHPAAAVCLNLVLVTVSSQPRGAHSVWGPL